MKIAIVGTGYVGLVTGTCFAEIGVDVTCVDTNIKKIKALEQRVYAEHQTQLFIETPYRNNKMVEDILHNCRPQTRLCIAANITCEGEYIRTKSIKEWQGKVPDLTKIPCIFLLYQ